VLLGPIISRLFTCSNAEKNKLKKQRVLALVLTLCLGIGTLRGCADAFHGKEGGIQVFGKSSSIEPNSRISSQITPGPAKSA
jgi:hypothetical protein